MVTRYYIGIDSGGTGTRAIVVDETGCIRGSGRSGSANRNHYSREQVRQSFRDAVRAALDPLPEGTCPTVVFVGTSGVSTGGDCREIAEIVRDIPEIGPDTHVLVENDTVAGLTGGLSGRAGIALVAGTGSACLGINERGERWSCGGWGALADDAGSAPWVGLRAVQAAVRAEDGRSEPTALREIVFDFLGLAEPRQLITRVHNQGLDRADLGALAPRVVQAYQDGDMTAGAILSEATMELSAIVSTTVRRLFGAAPCEMILVGGLARSGHPFQPMLTGRLCKDIPNLRVVEPELSPERGAALEALRADGVRWTEQVLSNLAIPVPDEPRSLSHA